MRRMTPAQFNAALLRWPALVTEALRDMARPVFTMLGAQAVNAHMRNGRGDAGARTNIRFTRTGRARRVSSSVPRRRADDDGPLRIESGKLAGALRMGAQGAVERVEPEGMRVRLSKGVGLGTVPYARIHELGGSAGRGLRSRIPARAFLGPARDDIAPRAVSLARRRFVASLRATVAGNPSLMGGAP